MKPWVDLLKAPWCFVVHEIWGKDLDVFHEGNTTYNLGIFLACSLKISCSVLLMKSGVRHECIIMNVPHEIWA